MSDAAPSPPAADPSPGASPRPGRRRLLKGTLAAAALAAAGAVAAAVRTSGYHVAPERARTLRALAPWELVFVEAAARRIAAPDRPGDATTPSADDVDVAGFVDAFVAGMAPRMRRDLGRLFAYVEHLAPLRLGLRRRFTSLDPGDQDRVLEALEASDVDLLRGGFEGLKALVFMGYYRDPRTWTILGYDGPTWRRPAAGWAAAAGGGRP